MSKPDIYTVTALCCALASHEPGEENTAINDVTICFLFFGLIN